jgi:hypothetical protein
MRGRILRLNLAPDASAVIGVPGASAMIGMLPDASAGVGVPTTVEVVVLGLTNVSVVVVLA